MLFLLFMGLLDSVQSQIITLKDNETQMPIELATIKSQNIKTNQTDRLTTNADGQADISLFKGAEIIEISRLGYQTRKLSYDSLVKLNFEILLISTITQFDQVVFSATRWKQTSNQIPSKISVISSKNIALYNPQTAADLLAISGEVFVQKSQQGGGSPMIRGFSTNRLLYTIDGIRMNSAIFRSGNLQNVISLDPFAIENTEVLFGPGSIIYGSDAIGGVMSFQTLTPRLSNTDKPLIIGKAMSRFSSANNEATHHFDVNVGGKKWASVTSLTHAKFGDLKMGKYGKDEYLKRYYVQRIDSVDRVVDNPDPRVQNPTGYSQINMMQKIRFKPNEQWNFEYGFHYSETSDYSRYDRLIETRSNGLPVSAIWNYGPQIWMMNNLMVTHEQKNKLYDVMNIRLAQQFFEESRIDRRLNHQRLRTNKEEVMAYSANIDFEKAVQKNRFYYGLEYVLNDVTSRGSAIDIRNGNPIAVPDRYPASKWSSYAAYLNYQYVISDKFLLQTGARFNVFNLTSDFTRHLSFFPFDFTQSKNNKSATTGSIGGVYSPNKTWKLSANVSTGFRAPNVDDMGKIFDFVSGEVVVPNTNLTAENAYNGEINVSKIVKDFIKVDLTGFYTFLDNAMVRRPFQVNGQDSILFNGQMSKVNAIQNAASATVYGFNAGVEIKLGSGFSINTKYNFQRGKEEMDNGIISPSRHAAPSFGQTQLTYQKNQLMMQVYAMYSAGVSYDQLNPEEQMKPAIYAKDMNGNPYSPSWYTLNFKAMYKFHQNLSIQSGIENLTDRRYRPYSSGLVAPGRNFIISLKAHF
jgi:hemoglobin/transferrin/lactoferrin receptor protein